MRPSFDWYTTEQYGDFQLFHKSVESRFHCRSQLHLTGVCAQFPGQHWPQEVWLLEADQHSWWDCEEKTGYSLHGLPVVYNGPCSITTLQDLPTGSCLHLTWRVTRWTCWPSLSSCWYMQLSDRRGNRVECPVQICQSPQWQGTCQEAACSWPDSNNTQDAWSVPHTHRHLRQPQGHGIEDTRQPMPYGGKTNLTKGRNL